MTIIARRAVHRRLDCERQLHEKFAEYRKTGEWFLIPEDKMGELMREFEENPEESNAVAHALATFT